MFPQFSVRAFKLPAKNPKRQASKRQRNLKSQETSDLSRIDFVHWFFLAFGHWRLGFFRPV
jgi:hypothetical protein